MPVLTVIDLVGIQRYIFSSHRLVDSVSSSWLVHWATSTEPAAPESSPAGALHEYKDHVLSAGGGTAVLEFETLDQARLFTARYTRALLDRVPGLEAVVVHKEYEPGHLAECLLDMGELVARAKVQRVPSTGLMGLGVTARCSITGTPAVDVADEDGPVSNVVSVWRSEVVKTAARNRWDRFLQSVGAGFYFPLDIDDMGRSRGEASFLGVVHIDGNGTGERIQDWLRRCELTPDEVVRRQYREWSKALDDTVREAFITVLTHLLSSIKDRRVGGQVADLELELRQTEMGIALPLRPLILGGDDLTFICDGRIALDLAHRALERFDGAVIPHLGEWSACAGVAIVRTHYPFFRAYETAESLCRAAKDKRRAQRDEGTWIDWHVGNITASRSVDEIRRTDYSTVLDGNRLQLTCRPYKLGSDCETETWKWLAEVLLGSSEGGFRSDPWLERKSKLKALMNLVREGPMAVSQALEAWRVVEPRLKFARGLTDDGYIEAVRTPLLDAIELLDLFLPLGAESEKGAKVQ